MGVLMYNCFVTSDNLSQVIIIDVDEEEATGPARKKRKKAPLRQTQLQLSESSRCQMTVCAFRLHDCVYLAGTP